MVGSFKVNTDVMVNGVGNHIGVVIVVRNHDSRVMRFAIDSGLIHAVIESDAKVVVDLVLSGVAPQADVGVIISDIFLLIGCNAISISYVPRRANMVAHNLAKLVVSSVNDCFWFEFFPSPMKDLVLADCLG
ncbi:hypothetical protein Dsin_012082 [Dipteronia sinensis]|uniref:RNase H type-1 domain-containing protein n=1 Tax=Dipteronia sinensis TaxID=43782 RepID=A0AAE0AIQ4_9ROSI|nr:hypothetical protein Dsin_012082 [Dipteronia sinensis]